MNHFVVGLTFFLCLSAFLFSGFWASKKGKNSVQDYLTASKDSNAFFVALSLFASYQSGYIFLGAVGYIFSKGVWGSWLLLGAFVGESLALLFGLSRFRLLLGQKNIQSFSGFLSAAQGKKQPYLAKISAILIATLMLFYAGAQLFSAAKIFSFFGEFNSLLVVFFSATLVLFYSFFGGMRATIYSDTLQAILMLASVIWLALMVLFSLHGFSSWWLLLKQTPQSYQEIIPKHLSSGFPLFFMGWAVGGFAILGQPHVMSRILATKSQKSAQNAAWLFVLFKLVFNVLLIFLALSVKLIFQKLGDPELSLLHLGAFLLPSFGVGLLLASLFSAILSSVDSQVLAASAAITQEIFPSFSKKLIYYRLSVLLVLFLAAVLAILPKNIGVFSWVVLVYGIYGAAFAPIVLAHLLSLKTQENTNIIALFLGAGLVIFFNYFKTSLGLEDVYEILWAFSLAFLWLLFSDVYLRFKGSKLSSRRGT